MSKDEYLNKKFKDFNQLNDLNKKKVKKAETREEKIGAMHGYYDQYILDNDKRVQEALRKPEIMEFYHKVRDLSVEVKYDMIEKRVKIVESYNNINNGKYDKAMDELIALLIYVQEKQMERSQDINSNKKQLIENINYVYVADYIKVLTVEEKEEKELYPDRLYENNNNNNDVYMHM